MVPPVGQTLALQGKSDVTSDTSWEGGSFSQGCCEAETFFLDQWQRPQTVYPQGREPITNSVRSPWTKWGSESHTVDLRRGIQYKCPKVSMP